MPGLTQQNKKVVFEDFVDATVIGTSATTAGVKWMNSSDAGNTAFAASDNATYGPICSGATDATDDDMMEISHRSLAWMPRNGRCWMEARVQVSVGAVASIALTVGFNDDQLEDSNTLPVELATATFTSNASTFVGVVYDADATNQDFHAFYVDGDSDASDAIAKLRFNGIAPVLSNWFTVRVVLDDNGSGNKARAEITVVDESTGKMMQKVFTSTVTRNTPLTPHIGFENRAGTAHTVLIDYIEVGQTRG